MDGRELREAVLREHSGGGTPYEVEVWYDGAGEQYFKGGWSQFAEDHDLHQDFFMTFDFHVGTSKFDVRIYDCTLMSTHASILVDSVGPPSAEVCRAAASFP
jgi:hypothetical protein